MNANDPIAVMAEAMFEEANFMAYMLLEARARRDTKRIIDLQKACAETEARLAMLADKAGQYLDQFYKES